MSIERTPRGEYRVRWREGSRNRSKVTGPRKKDAEAFEQEIKRAKRLGTLAQVSTGTKLLSEFGTEWWRRHAPRTAIKTQKNYAWSWDTYIWPRFGDLQLRQISAGDVEEWLADLADDEVGTEAQRKALKLLRQVLKAAVRSGEIATNPANLVEMPRSLPPIEVPPTPIEVERIRATLRSEGRFQDALLVCVMAYAGLRPHETWELTWSDVRERTILVRARRKVGAKGRAVRLLAPLASDLAESRLAADSRQLLVFPSGWGRQWTTTTFNNWRRRVFKRIAPDQRPYALRHSFVSLLIAEGRSTLAVAKEAGNSPELCLRIYGHLWDEYEGRASEERLSAEEVIRNARQEVQMREAVNARV
jgi:integrase